MADERKQSLFIVAYEGKDTADEVWHKMRDLGVIAWAEAKMAQGLIGHLGFSFHGVFEGFKEIVDGKHDELPEQAFYMCGGIDEAFANAEKMAAEIRQKSAGRKPAVDLIAEDILRLVIRKQEAAVVH